MAAAAPRLAENAGGQDGPSRARKANLTSMHSLLDTLIRGTSYFHEEAKYDEKELQGSETHADKDNTEGRQNAPRQFMDYFVRLHQRRAKDAHEQENWEEAKAELALAEQEHRRQVRRQSMGKNEERFSLHLDAIKTHSNSSATLPSAEEGDYALRRMHSQLQPSEETTEEESLSSPWLLKGDEEDEDVVARTTSGRSDRSSTPQVMTDAEKLAAIKAEFGPSDGAGVDGEEERLIAGEGAALFRRVLIVGYAVLTNHRFCFIAYLPNEPHSPTRDGHLTSRNILRQSPAILHRPGLTRRKRKAWFVLSSHSITAYPSSNELYEPLGSMLLADIDDVVPARHHNRHTVAFGYRKHACYLEFETEEGAALWFKELDLARWRLAHNVDKVRIAVPLVRIAQTRFQEYLQAVILLHMDVLDDSLFFQSGQHRHDALQQRLHRNPPEHVITPNTQIVFGLHNHTSKIVSEIQAAVKRPTEWRLLREKEDWWSLPTPIIEIDGPNSLTGEAEQGQSGDGDERTLQKRIIEEFSLSCKAEEVRLIKAEIVRTIPSAGVLALSPAYLCFYRRRRLTGLADTRIKIPVEHLKKVLPSRAFRWHHFGLRILIQAHEDVLFEFHQAKYRDKAMELLHTAIDEVEEQRREGLKQSSQRKAQSSQISPGRALASQAEGDTLTLPAHAINKLPRAANVVSTTKRLRVDPLKIICLTIGSRGDVQPYIALCKELQKQNHECIIVSHDEYEGWVRSYGIDFRPAGGDPAALMKLSVDNKMYSPTFFREAVSKFKHWLDELLRDIMSACWDADLLIESPSTFGGIHVAEAVGCYYMRAFTMPWTRTSAYPQAFSVPSVDYGPQYNIMSYTMFDQLLWTASSGQINRWRKHMLNLAPTSMAKLHTDSVPFMYNFSPAVVPPPLDWGSLTAVTGYWTLNEKETKFDPPDDLVQFIRKAKKEEKKLCYIGFGSITIANPRALQKAIYEAVQKSDVRAIVSKGWSDRLSTKANGETEVLVAPEEVYIVDSIPHDWLFPQIDIAMHHGGAGTTGASLKAGLVTLIHPFFGDQYFWSGRVDKLGAGVRVRSLKAETISDALIRARDNRVMKEKAEMVGAAIREENGLSNAIHFIYTNLSRSRRVKRVRAEQMEGSSQSNGHTPVVTSDEDEMESDEEDDTKYRELLSGRRSTTSSSLLSYNGLKQATYHPIDTLSRSRSFKMMKPLSPKKGSTQLADVAKDDNEDHSNQLELKQSPLPVEDSGETKEQEGDSALEETSQEPQVADRRRSSLFKLPDMMKLGIGSRGEEGKESEAPSEEEIKRRKEEERQKHTSAKEEDQRRRELLIEVWKKEKRWDLVGEAGPEEEAEEELPR